MTVPAEFVGTLQVATPQAWFDHAVQHIDELLVDHANCEKKAASTALSLIFTYSEDMELTDRISRLAREELRHFEQVQRLMRKLNVSFRRMAPSRYGEGLRKAIRHNEPARLQDLLICGALIEARSCERFMGLSPLLEDPLRSFYVGLSASEARHHELYIQLAQARYADEWRDTLNRISAVEAELITSPDEQLRFHSGMPVT
ncbi:MAG TPA: tRNA-(ms[2]io[6]A)-hydroxylase [Steroidobacteraceae bacterium]|jgi:tRNA-(ms[2]io[6]A)-hydroxylase|nr:tRNA-(ms[2]io[6]A)-hydroxylase [Steroidobacteraceae bacterium]